MAFCKYCGRQLTDGEVCTCEGAVKAAASAAQSMVSNAAQTADNAQNYGAQAAGNVQDYAAQTAANAQNYAVQPANYGQDYTVPAASGSSGGLGAFVKKYLLFICIGGGVLVAGIVLLLILTLGGGSGGYKAPIEKLVKEINKGESVDLIDLYTSTYPSELAGLYKSFYELMGSEDPLEDQKERMADNFADLKDEYPGWKIKFEYSDSEPAAMGKTDLKTVKNRIADKENLEDYIERLEDREDDYVDQLVDAFDADEKAVRAYYKSARQYIESLKKAEISEGLEVKGRFVITNDGEEINKTDTLTLYIVKINNEWLFYSYKKGEPDFKSGSKYDSYSYVSFLSEILYETYRRNYLPPFSY